MSIGEHCYITWKEEHCRELSVLHYLEGRALPCVITLTGRKSIAKSYYINWKEEHCQELLHYLEGKALPRDITIPGRKSIANNYYLLGRKSIAENSRIVFAQAAVAPKRAQCYLRCLFTVTVSLLIYCIINTCSL